MPLDDVEVRVNPKVTLTDTYHLLISSSSGDRAIGFVVNENLEIVLVDRKSNTRVIVKDSQEFIDGLIESAFSR